MPNIDPDLNDTLQNETVYNYDDFEIRADKFLALLDEFKNSEVKEQHDRIIK